MNKNAYGCVFFLLLLADAQNFSVFVYSVSQTIPCHARIVKWDICVGRYCVHARYEGCT